MAELLGIRLEAPAAKAEIRSTKTEEGVVIEDVAWAASDGQTVPGYVIRPANARGRLPAVVCLHGTGGSRDSETTQHFGDGQWTRAGQKTPHKRMLGWARELSRRGYVTLSITQRGLDTRTPGTDHQGKDMLVRGRTVMGLIVDEIRQAITHLASRADVDPKRIGIAGMSFGGITAFYTWIVDPRIAAAAPICGGVGSLDVLLAKGSPGYHGLYWWIPDMLTKGDQGEFAARMAPRPLMLWAPLNDIGMPAEGVERFVKVVAPAYEKAGAREALVVHRPPGEHAFTIEAFDAMLAFFNKTLAR
jgi:dienelactone hydrolase